MLAAQIVHGLSLRRAKPLPAGAEQAREWQACGSGATARVATLPDYQ
jgi:hypothetical protein